jgi:glycogen debranching enzyme
VQGYVYDAKRRLAEIARTVWRDRALSERLDAEADELRRRFDRAFWCEERGGFYALALDGEKRRVDSVTSNIGHLLWSGIVPSERLDAVCDQLMGEALWSGWGVRTMSAGDAGYSPLAYHDGTVWPHDNSLIAWGLARAGRCSEAQRIPTAARPQAWAAATPVLLLRVLLGLEPDQRRHALTTVAPPELPSWAGALRLSGVQAFDRSWNVVLENGAVRVEEAAGQALAP